MGERGEIPFFSWPHTKCAVSWQSDFHKNLAAGNQRGHKVLVWALISAHRAGGDNRGKIKIIAFRKTPIAQVFDLYQLTLEATRGAGDSQAPRRGRSLPGGPASNLQYSLAIVTTVRPIGSRHTEIPGNGVSLNRQNIRQPLPLPKSLSDRCRNPRKPGSEQARRTPVVTTASSEGTQLLFIFDPPLS